MGLDEYGFKDEEMDLPEKVAGWFMQKPMSSQRKSQRFELGFE